MSRFISVITFAFLASGCGGERQAEEVKATISKATRFLRQRASTMA